MIWYADGSGWNGRRSRYAVVSSTEKYIFETKEEFTNNEMEYLGAIRAAELAIENSVIATDSALVVNQVSGKFKVRKEHLKKYHKKLKKLCEEKQLELIWVPRKENEAGKLLERIQGHWL